MHCICKDKDDVDDEDGKDSKHNDTNREIKDQMM